jgi:hypothetical protein
MLRVIPLLPQYAFMVCCTVKRHRDDYNVVIEAQYGIKFQENMSQDVEVHLYP